MLSDPEYECRLDWFAGDDAQRKVSSWDMMWISLGVGRELVEKWLERSHLVGHADVVPKGQLAVRDHLNDRRGSFGLFIYPSQSRPLDPRSLAC